jgi:hypothetical protein
MDKFKRIISKITSGEKGKDIFNQRKEWFKKGESALLSLCSG